MYVQLEQSAGVTVVLDCGMADTSPDSISPDTGLQCSHCVPYLTFCNVCVCMQLGQSAGVTVVLDCGGAEASISPDLLKHLTIISPNESELANLTGKPLPVLQWIPRRQNENG